MKKIYSLGCRLFACVALCGSVMLLSTSCVDEGYDLSAGIDMEMNVGGSFTIPLGTSAPIALSDMLDTTEIEMLEEIDGEYKITMSDFISIDIESIAGEDGVSVSAISPDPETITTDFEKPEFPSFSIDIEPQVIDAAPDGISPVYLGDPNRLDESINVSPDLSSGLIPESANQTISDIPILLDVEEKPIELTVADNVSCPDQVVKVYDISIGSPVYVAFDVSALANRFTQESFELEVPHIEITFPEGFLLDSGSNVVRKENLTNEGDAVLFSFNIVSYDGDLVRLESGYLDPIVGEITCDIANEITISGTTVQYTAQEDEDNTMKVNITSDIEIKDMMLEVDNINVEVNPGEELSEPTTIDNIPDLIYSVSDITLDESGNNINIHISHLDIPDNLIASGNDIEILFPKSKFELSEDVVTLRGDDYVLSVPISDIAGSEIKYTQFEGVTYDGFFESIEIITIHVDGVVTPGDEKDTGTVPFDPNIRMVGTTVDMYGDMLLGDFNDFIADENTITATAETATLEVAEAEISINNYVAELDEVRNEIKEEIELPEELKSIDSMTFRSPVYLSIDIDVELAGTDAALSFEDYTIEFPRFLKFAEGVEVDSDNVMVLNNIFDVTSTGRSFSNKYEIELLDFTDSQYQTLFENMGEDNLLKLNEVAVMNGSIKLAAGDVDSSDLNESIVANVTFGINEMQIQKVYGIVSPEIPAESTEIDLSALTEVVEGEFSAVLTNPTIVIEASNSLEIPLEISTFNLLPCKGGEVINTISIDKAIQIAPAVDGIPATTNIYISAYADSSQDTTYEKHVLMNNIKEILVGLPDTIEFSYEADVVEVEGENHMIDLYTEYSFTLDYNLDVPLTFDSLSLDYTYTMEDLGESLEGVVDMINSVELELEFTNELPLTLTIASITPIDADGTAITTLDPIFEDGSNSILANGKSSLIATLTNNDAGDLSRIDGLEVAISAVIDSTEDGSALRADQSIVIGIVARIPNGVNLDLNSEDEE